MARIEVAMQAWGYVVDTHGHPVAGALCEIDTTVYAATTGGTTIAAASFVSNSEGYLPGFVDAGTYTFTDSDGDEFQVDAPAGAGGPAGPTGPAGPIGGEVPPGWVCVTDSPYNAVGDGVTDDTAAIQAAVDAAAGTIFIPAGSYLISDEITLLDNIIIQGAGKLLTIFRNAPAFSGLMLRASEDPSGTHGSYANVVVSDLTLDGDSMNSTVAEAVSGNPLLHAYNCSGVKFYRCRFINSRSYGVGFQGYPTQANTTARGPIEDLYLQGCEFYANGFRKTGDTTTLAEDLDATETTISLTDATAFASAGTILVGSEKVRYTGKSTNDLTGCVRGSYATTAATVANGATVSELALYDDGLDCKSSQRVNLIDCKFYGNADDGCDIRAHYLSMTGCFGYSNNNGGLVVSVALPGGSMTETDGFATLNGCFGWSNGVNGIRVEAPEATRIGRVALNGCGARDNEEANLLCDGHGGGDLYVSIAGGHYVASVAGSGIELNACARANLSDGFTQDNAVLYGIQVANMPDGMGVTNWTSTGNARGLRATGTTDKVRISGGEFTSNATADITLTGTLNRLAEDVEHGLSTPQIASTAALAPSQLADRMIVTGTADITSLEVTAARRVITLRFSGTAATNGLVDGNNLKLAGSLAYTPDDMITLAHDGTNYFEMARSVN